MNINKLYIIKLFIGLMVVSCKTLETDNSIAENPLPESFSQNGELTGIEQLNWKDYFSDSLLIALIDTALDRNYDLQASLQRIEMAHADVRFARGQLLPSIEGLASHSRLGFGENSADWAGNEGGTFADGTTLNRTAVPDYYVGIQTSWEADVRGRLKNQKRAALASYLASVEGTQFIVTNLIAEVANNYYNLLALDSELEIIRETIQKQEEALEVVKLNKEVGRASALAVQQFQAQLLDTRALERSTLQLIAQSENRINFLMGRYPQPIARFRNNFGEQVIPEQINYGIPSDLLDNRADIREARQMMEASRFDLKAAKAAFYPSVTINAGLGLQAFKPEFLVDGPASITYGLLGQLAAPLINRSAIRAQFEGAKANQLESMYRYQQTVLNGYVEVYNELIYLNNQQEIVRFSSEENEVLQASVETSYELFRYGKASYLEVLIAQQNALEAQLDLVRDRRELQLSVVNLYRALGGGWDN